LNSIPNPHYIFAVNRQTTTYTWKSRPIDFAMPCRLRLLMVT
jgi:hypothetical protein